MKKIEYSRKFSLAVLTIAFIISTFPAGLPCAQELPAPSEEVKAILTQAQDLEKAGKIDEAFAVLMMGRELFPESLHLQEAAFRTLFRAQRYQECLDFINKMFAGAPEAFKKDVLVRKRDVLVNLFMQAAEKKDYEKSLGYLREAADLGYKHPVYLYYLEAFKPLRNLGGYEDVLHKIEANAGVGSVPEDFTVALMDGRDWTLSKQKGKVTLVYFWDTACVPCVRELPTVRKIYADFQNQGLDVLTISLDDDKAKLEGFLKKNPFPWKQVFSGNGWDDALAKRFGVDGTPYSFLIDKNGIMRAFDVRGEDLEKEAARLVADQVSTGR